MSPWRALCAWRKTAGACSFFCFEDVFDKRLREASKEAFYAERMVVVVGQARNDIEEGRCVEGAAEALAAI